MTSRIHRPSVLAFGAIVLAACMQLACGSQTTTDVAQPTVGATEEPAPTSAAPTTTAPTATAPTATAPTGTAPPGAAAPADEAETAPPPFPPEGRPELLSEWGQLTIDDGELTLTAGVTPYTLNSALFSDYAEKLRTVWLPDGTSADYQPEEVFDFPIGTVITKTFHYPVATPGDLTSVRKVTRSSPTITSTLDLATTRLVETRVLVHRSEGWVALPYVWNDEQTEATLERTGDIIRLTAVDDGSDTSTEATTSTDFAYIVPNVNQCAGCHATNHTTKVVVPIGPKARHLNGDVDFGAGAEPQLAAWIDRGILASAPDLDSIPKSTIWDDDTATLDARARSYLDINCAHCHNRNGPADTSGLFLEVSTEEGPRLGLCKPPIAAGTGTGGRLVGIEPGEPEDSIFVFRMQTEDPASMMPELGRALTHVEGVDLISSWIESLDGSC